MEDPDSIERGARCIAVRLWIIQMALILGAVSFLGFWLNDLVTDEDEILFYGVSWALLLAIHGSSILLLTAGFVGAALVARPAAQRPVIVASVAAAVVGLWTFFPIFYLGIAGIGAWTIVRRGVTSGLLLLVGALLVLVAWSSGVRLGFEDGPDPNLVQALLTGGGLTLCAAGLAQLALQLRTYAAVR